MTAPWSDPWYGVFHRWKHDGEYPSGQEIADALRAEPKVPDSLVEYVAGRLDGSVRAPVGNPGLTAADRLERWAELNQLAVDFRMVHAAFRLQGVQGPRDRALKVVAKQRHIAPSTLETRLRKEVGPLLKASTLQESEAQMRKLVDEGIIRLDPELGYSPVPDG
jgi:hypothetical protein